MQEYRYYINFKTKKFAYTSSDKLSAELLAKGFVHVATPNCSLQSHPGIRVEDVYAAVVKPTKLTDDVRGKIATNFMRTVLESYFRTGFSTQKDLEQQVDRYEKYAAEKGTESDYWKKQLPRAKKLLKYGANNIPWKVVRREDNRDIFNSIYFESQTLEVVKRALDRSQVDLATKIANKISAYVMDRWDTIQPFNKIEIKKDVLAILSKLP